MNFEQYLKTFQPLVYNTFKNAKEKKLLSHAYLIKGNMGAPILNVAKYLAKSLICDLNNVFACDNCPTCQRFDENNYADFVLLNAQKEVLKVADIDNLTKRFSSTAMENKGIMIYIIHHVENMNRESINALLKFLEEPRDNIYAFLTTENEEKVLPTILSRCQHLKLLPLNKNYLYETCLNEEGIDKLDLELILNFENDISSLKLMLQDETYLLVKNEFLAFIRELSSSLYNGYYYLQKETITKIKTKEQVRLFIDMIATFFKEMINLKNNNKCYLSSLKDYLEIISNLIEKKEDCYKKIMFTRGQIELNVTVALIIEHIGFIIVKGGQNDSTNS